jgi:excisionase family DNA binding protein
MAGKFQDESIAATLNRLGLRTGMDQSWSESKVYSARHYHQLPAYNPNRASDGVVTMEEAAHRLGVSSTSIRRLIKLKKMPAHQIVACAPWQIPIEALDSEEVRRAVRNIKERVRVPQTQGSDQQQAMFPMVSRDNS